jgi:hypothetical protein
LTLEKSDKLKVLYNKANSLIASQNTALQLQVCTDVSASRELGDLARINMGALKCYVTHALIDKDARDSRQALINI